MLELRARRVDVGVLRARRFELRVGLRDRRRVDRTGRELLLQQRQCVRVRVYRVVEQLLLRVERAQREIVGRQLGRHRQLHGLQVGRARGGVRLRARHRIAHAAENVGLPARGHAGLIVGRGLAGQRRAEPVLRHACAALRDACGDRRQEPRMLVVDHRAGLLQIGERFLHRLVRYVDARFERVQVGVAEHGPPCAARGVVGRHRDVPAGLRGRCSRCGRCARVVRRHGDRGR